MSDLLRDHNGTIYREVTRPDGFIWREYQLDYVVAKRVKELKLGLSGEREHTWRALAIRVTGCEDQMTGSDLERLACWTLQHFDKGTCWCERCELSAPETKDSDEA